MKRAYLVEMTIFASYVRQLLLLGFLVSLFVCCGMQSIIAAPAILTCICFMTGAAGAAGYDEQNNWGLFRLTMPLSRRDVVLARYGVIVTLGLVGLAAGLVGAGLVTALATFVDLPMGLSAVLAYRFEDVLATLFSSFFCIFMGSFVAGVVTPLYFRFGQSKATQYLPLIMVLVFFALPVSLIGNSGLLDGGIVGTDALTSLLAFIETPAGVAASMVVLLAASALVLAVSAAVSLRLYERREL